MAASARAFPRDLSPNERKLVSLTLRHGPLTRRDAARLGGISWATIVKLFRRLEEEGFIVEAGTDTRPNVRGPSSLLYRLAPDFPLAIGIDIEYTTTTATAVDLAGNPHHLVTRKTPGLRSVEALAEYCLSIRSEVLEVEHIEPKSVVGTGVGIPSALISKTPVYASLRRDLRARVRGLVEVEDVAVAHGIARQYHRHPDPNLAVFSLRSGIGLGLSVNGRLVLNESEQPPLIAHAVMRPHHGEPCPRCGHRGCLENLMNKWSVDGGVLNRAAAGDPVARDRAIACADVLAQAISMIVLTVGILRIVIVGSFGSQAELFASMVRNSLPLYVPGFIHTSITAENIVARDFATGAGILVLRHFFDIAYLDSSPNLDSGRNP